MTGAPLAVPARERVVEGAVQAGMLVGVVAGVLALSALVVDVIGDGAGRLTPTLLSAYTSSDPDLAGLRAAILGSLLLLAVAVAVALPLGVATAVYLEEYVDRRSRWARMVEVNLQNLAAVPSIVYGILGLAFLVRGPLGLGSVVLAGGLTLAMLVLPIIVVTSRDAIRAVPSSLREGAAALGASRWQTTSRVVLPAAVPGIATGLILAMAEAIGQAAPLIMVGAASFIATDPTLLSQYTALPIQIFSWSSRPQEEFRELAAAGIILLLTLLVLLNLSVVWIRARFERA